jgi:predicted deacylase
VADPFGEEQRALRAPFAGIVIGVDRNPVVHGGDAVVHVGRLGAEG